MKKQAKTSLHAPRGGFYFAPGTVESRKAARRWLLIAREWAICIAIAVAVGTVSAFFNSRI